MGKKEAERDKRRKKKACNSRQEQEGEGASANELLGKRGNGVRGKIEGKKKKKGEHAQSAMEERQKKKKPAPPGTVSMKNWRRQAEVIKKRIEKDRWGEKLR